MSDLGLCNMCDQRPATKVYGLPVCHLCFDNLTALNEHLKEMEAADPVLADLGQKVEDEAKRWMEQP